MSEFETAKAELIKNIEAQAASVIDGIKAVKSEGDLSSMKEAVSKLGDDALAAVTGGAGMGNLRFGVEYVAPGEGGPPEGVDGSAWYAEQNLKIVERNNRQMQANARFFFEGKFSQIDNNYQNYHHSGGGK